MITILKITLTAILIMMMQWKTPAQNIFNSANNRKHSDREENLMTQFSIAKNSGERSKMQDIQAKLDNETGSVTKPAENYPGTFVLVNKPVNNNDNINIVELSQLSGIQAFTTVTEQRGQNIGRIWVAAAVSNSTARDTIFYFRSDDGGTSWVLYGFIYLANSDQVNYDQMDMEMIEDNTGDKYIWLYYGLTAANGKQFIGAAIMKTPNLLVNEIIMTWPGENLSNPNFGRFRPRITSDNAKYSNTSSLFISASVDSIDGNFHIGEYCLAKCNNPYTTTPLITYVHINFGLTPSSNDPTDYHTDLAYVNNGGDSILFVLSHYYVIPSLMEVGSFNTNFSNSATVANLPNFSAYNKEFGKLACSGGTNQPTVMLIFRENYQNSGDWDLKGYRTINGGITWGDVNIDIRRDNVMIPYPAEISSVRNRDGRFNICYTVSGPANYDTVKYLFSNSGAPGFFYRTINHLSGFQRPKPGVRLVNNDSCFAVWSQRNGGSGNNIWAVEGCSGQITIGIENTGSEIPDAFKLEQNYPNPFNPSTKINFAVPKSSFVSLVIYDINGKEVSKLVNENLAAGNYKADFDATKLSSGVYFYKFATDDYTQTKKMILMK